MNIKKIFNILTEHQYNYAKSSNPQYLFFCKNTEDAFSAVILIDDINYSQTTDPLIFTSMRESLENTFLLRGCKEVNVLFVILAKNPFAYKNFADSDFIFWVADTNSGRIISYSDNDEYFSSMRDSLEACLSMPDDRHAGKRNQKYGVFQSIPLFTTIFALINICIFIYMDYFCNFLELENIYAQYSCNWKMIFEEGQYYRLFTCMFIHYGFDHLFNNMITLFAIGYLLEPVLGHIKFSIIYILSGLSASLCSAMYYSSVDDNVLSGGASGAIFGIFGAYAVCALFDMLKQKNVSFSRIALISLLMLYNGMTNENVDNAAHLGGIIFGCLIAFICCISKKNEI